VPSPTAEAVPAAVAVEAPDWDAVAVDPVDEDAESGAAFTTTAKVPSALFSQDTTSDPSRMCGISPNRSTYPTREAWNRVR